MAQKRNLENKKNPRDGGGNVYISP